MAEVVRCHVVLASQQNVTNILDVVQDVLILGRLVHEFFRPGEGRSDSVQVESEHNWIDRGDLEFFEDTIPDSKYIDQAQTSIDQRERVQLQLSVAEGKLRGASQT